jgi:hypothetical protein
MTGSKPVLLSIIELGGYPDYTTLYRDCGFEVVSTDSVRKAVKLIRKHRPAVIVAEFNFQSDFRDRTSSLETEYAHQYQRVLDQFSVFESLAFPIDENALRGVLNAAHPVNG